MTNQRMSYNNSARDLVDTVAVVLGQRSDDLLLSHDGVVLGATEARLAKLFLGDIEELLRKEHGDNGNFDIALRCVTNKMDMSRRKVLTSFGPPFGAAPGKTFREYRRLNELWIAGGDGPAAGHRDRRAHCADA